MTTRPSVQSHASTANRADTPRVSKSKASKLLSRQAVYNRRVRTSNAALSSPVGGSVANFLHPRSHSQPGSGASLPTETEPTLLSTEDQLDPAGGPGSEDAKAPAKSIVRDVIQTVVVAVLIFLAIRAVVLNFKVDGFSMMPNLTNNEMLLVNRREYSHINLYSLVDWIPFANIHGDHEWYPFRPPKRGDIIVFYPPNGSTEPYIKRIIGLPGDQVAIKNNHVYINGQLLHESYIDEPTTWPGILQSDQFTVQPGHVFVLGDNRLNSTDSRYFGQVTMSSIVGRAWLTYWPLGSMHILSDPSYSTH